MAAKTYQVVLGQIETDLAAGRLLVGGRLPAERILAQRYGVSRASVREAIRVLEAMGVIRTAVGSGPEAGATVIAEPAAPMGAAMRWHLASHHLPVADLVGARVLIESWAAEQVGAAAAAAPEILLPARELLLAMDSAALSAHEFLALDARFHVTLAELAGNVVITAVMTAMRDGIQAYVTAAVAQYPDWAGMVDRLRGEHHGILEAVAAGNGPLAGRIVADHINGFYADTGVGQN